MRDRYERKHRATVRGILRGTAVCPATKPPRDDLVTLHHAMTRPGDERCDDPACACQQREPIPAEPSDVHP